MIILFSMFFPIYIILLNSCLQCYIITSVSSHSPLLEKVFFQTGVSYVKSKLSVLTFFVASLAELDGTFMHLRIDSPKSCTFQLQQISCS